MSRLTDHQLDTLLHDAGVLDRTFKNMWPMKGYEPILPRLTRLLEEQRELRDQAAERTHMAEIEGAN